MRPLLPPQWTTPNVSDIGDAISVDLLLRHGASPHQTDNSGMTPLHWASVKGSKASIKHLLSAGAGFDVKESNGKTPRDMAEELKGLVPFEAALEEGGFDRFGRKKEGRLSEVSLFVGMLLME
jgi:ankyrin repeat protein